MAITFGSVAGAAVYWAFLTAIGVLLAAGGLLELRRRGVRFRRWHLAAAFVTTLAFAALGYAGVGRAFYALERTDAGVALSYHWPAREVVIPWDSIRTVNTAPGYKGQRPLRVAVRSGREHLSALIPVREALRLSACLNADLARHRSAGGPASAMPDGCP
ncbi:MAG TPA: hypothetical protein VFM14_04335 [Gemmatimonadales bacterium]|nr:hypothetical protein [Gemmatimonadales bacterium]